MSGNRTADRLVAGGLVAGNLVAGGVADIGIERDRNGPSIVLVGICVAMITLGLTVLGMNVWNRHPTVETFQRPPMSAEAAALNYTREELYRADISMADDALLRVLRGVGGSQLLWENAESGNRGITWNSFENRRGCRDIERRTMINGMFREEIATACRDAAGHWPSSFAWNRK